VSLKAREIWGLRWTSADKGLSWNLSHKGYTWRWVPHNWLSLQDKGGWLNVAVLSDFHQASSWVLGFCVGVAMGLDRAANIAANDGAEPAGPAGSEP